MALGSLVRTMASWLGRLLSLSLSSLKTSGASVTGSRERWGVLTELRSETRGVQFRVVTNKMLCWGLGAEGDLDILFRDRKSWL